MFAFTRQFTETPDFQTGRFILCPVLKNFPIQRTEGKWVVSYDEVPASEGDIYPDYCQGWSYVLTPSTAAAIVEAAKHLRFVWVDDAWVTGYIATYLNITLQVSVIEWGIKVVRAKKKDRA